MISREAAILEIERFNGYIDDDMVGRIQTALRRLPAAEPKTRKWIPMSERNPMVGQDVLVTTRNGRIYVVTYAIKEWIPEHCFLWKPNFMGTEYLDANDVIAWMPLPEPYQEDV